MPFLLSNPTVPLLGPRQVLVHTVAISTAVSLFAVFYKARCSVACCQDRKLYCKVPLLPLCLLTLSKQAHFGSCGDAQSQQNVHTCGAQVLHMAMCGKGLLLILHKAVGHAI